MGSSTVKIFLVWSFKKLINEAIDEDKIRKIAFKTYKSLIHDGEDKVQKGITSDLELKRVLKQVD